MPLITTNGLSKHFQRPRKAPGLAAALRHIVRPSYEEKIALDSIDLSIEPGEMLGYVGPNGAGKSTTVKLMTGILVPSAGEVRIAGLIPHRNRIQVARQIGVVFGQRTQLWWDLPVQESFRLLGDLYQVPAADFTNMLHSCVELLELEPLLTTPARQLSLGQRMRCDLAATLLHTPSILFLDEPTIGLGVAVKARIRSFIKTMQHERGVTVLLTSHDLGDIADLCQRLIMLDKGKIVFDGPLESIMQRFGRERVIHLLLNSVAPDAAVHIQAALPELAPDAIRQPEPHRLAIAFDSAQITSAAIASRVFPLLSVADLRIEEPTIESIIGQLYTGALQFGEAV